MRNALIGLAALAVTLAAGAHAADAPPPKAHTDTGWVQGVRTPDQLAIYKGIPFAKPPVGDLRWRAPQKPQPWADTLVADHFQPACIQGQGSRTADRPPSEDCLYLNVWEPKGAAAGTKLPVMMWIYGGGFRGGTGSMPLFDGQAFARKGVILVTINYRLGKFGFMAHPELSKESGHNASGNYGLMDQIAALQWIQRNIAAFGGDPRNVTVFGQSAGGHSVNYLTATPLAKGLFAKAIAESGGAFAPAHATVFGHTLRTLQQTEQRGLAMQALFHANSIADLRKVPAKDIQAAPVLDDDDMGWVTLDGYAMPDTVDHIFAQSRQNDVPTIIGFNSNEGATFGHESTLAAFDKTTAHDFGARAGDYSKLYPAKDDVTAEHSSEEAARDNHFGWQTWTWAHEQHAHGKSPLYYFFFDIRPPVTGASPTDWGAHHEHELPYVFGNQYPANWGWTERDRRLSNVVQDYWVNFAKTGNPNGAGLPAWSAFDPAKPELMLFNEHPSQQPVPNQQRIAFWDQLAKAQQ
jgi:para-nitrobenzyl esterase